MRISFYVLLKMVIHNFWSVKGNLKKNIVKKKRGEKVYKNFAQRPENRVLGEKKIH